MSTQTNSIQGGEFLVRETPAQDIFIPEEFSEEQKMIAQTCRDFVAMGIDRIPKTFSHHWPNFCAHFFMCIKNTRINLIDYN